MVGLLLRLPSLEGPTHCSAGPPTLPTRVVFAPVAAIAAKCSTPGRPPVGEPSIYPHGKAWRGPLGVVFCGGPRSKGVVPETTRSPQDRGPERHPQRIRRPRDIPSRRLRRVRTPQDVPVSLWLCRRDLNTASPPYYRWALDR